MPDVILSPANEESVAMKLAIKPSLLLLPATLIWTAALTAADSVSVAKLYDSELKSVESQFVPLAEAMPEEKYDFRPSEGAFQKVRTFGQQIKHVAAVMYLVAAASQGQKPPADVGSGENGPDSIKTKAE